MEKIRDFIYNKNDILIALVIIMLAALVMFNRIDVIMAYPATVASGVISNTTDEAPPVNNGTADDSKENTGNVTSEDSGDNADGVTSGSAVSVKTEHPVYVDAGSTAATIGDALVAVNLVKSRDEFVSAVNSAGLASRLKSGQFYIPSDSTLEQTIAILTN